jgi:hypothetical protein
MVWGQHGSPLRSHVRGRYVGRPAGPCATSGWGRARPTLQMGAETTGFGLCLTPAIYLNTGRESCAIGIEIEFWRPRRWFGERSCWRIGMRDMPSPACLFGGRVGCMLHQGAIGPHPAAPRHSGGGCYGDRVPMRSALTPLPRAPNIGSGGYRMSVPMRSRSERIGTPNSGPLP